MFHQPPPPAALKARFDTAVAGARMVLDDPFCDTPDKIRTGLVAVVQAYQAMRAVRHAHDRHLESGIPQWKTLLRDAKPRATEDLAAYRQRITHSLDDLLRYSARSLRP